MASGINKETLNNKINVVHLSTHLGGGAGKAAFRIHQMLLEQGINSSFICLDKITDDDNLRKYSFLNFKKSFLQRIVSKLKNIPKVIINKKTKKLKAEILESYTQIKKKTGDTFTTIPFSSTDILNHPLVQKADIIHLHWTSGLLAWENFFKENKRPVVWTLHDMNPIKGIFHYQEDEDVNLKDTAEFNTKILGYKKKLIEDSTQKLQYVTPSIWLSEFVMKSGFRFSEHVKIVENPIGSNFHISDTDSLSKTEFNIPNDNLVLLFVAEKISDRRKGFDLLVQALDEIKELPVTLLVVGHHSDISFPNHDVRLLGVIDDENMMRRAYASADAFILPSREDNLPNVMVESLCCGTPVIAFDTGGMKETIVNYENGIKVQDISGVALALAIRDFSKKKESFCRSGISYSAQSRFSMEKVFVKYEKVYSDLLHEASFKKLNL